MKNDLVGSMLPLMLDIYRQSVIQDPDTGALNRVWQLHKTINCSAKGNISNSSSARGSNQRTKFGQDYKNLNEIQIRTEHYISFRDKVGNIRQQDGKPIWTEIDSPNNTPTIFDITGSTPILDPYGREIAWNLIAARSENQRLGEV